MSLCDDFMVLLGFKFIGFVVLSTMLVENMDRLKLSKTKKEALIYFIVTIVIVFFAAVFGPLFFKLINYTVSDPYTVTSSDSIGYFLEALLSVVIGAMLSKMAKNEN